MNIFFKGYFNHNLDWIFAFKSYIEFSLSLNYGFLTKIKEQIQVILDLVNLLTLIRVSF